MNQNVFFKVYACWHALKWLVHSQKGAIPKTEVSYIGVNPLARFHAKTTIGPEWFHQLQPALVIRFC
jgi:hypothetical protein